MHVRGLMKPWKWAPANYHPQRRNRKMDEKQRRWMRSARESEQSSPACCCSTTITAAAPPPPPPHLARCLRFHPLHCCLSVLHIAHHRDYLSKEPPLLALSSDPLTSRIPQLQCSLRAIKQTNNPSQRRAFSPAHLAWRAWLAFHLLHAVGDSVPVGFANDRCGVLISHLVDVRGDESRQG